KIFDQIRVNPEIPVKAVQDQLQCDLKLHVSMSKAFRAKAKAKREYGNPPCEGLKPFAVRPSIKLGQRSDLFKSNTHDLPLHQSFPAKVENVVIKDLAIPQASQELFDPIEA
ncbi:hypothetical protein Tco_1280087, partial [Tanacetum coccineum]